MRQHKLLVPVNDAERLAIMTAAVSAGYRTVTGYIRERLGLEQVQVGRPVSKSQKAKGERRKAKDGGQMKWQS